MKLRYREWSQSLDLSCCWPLLQSTCGTTLSQEM